MTRARKSRKSNGRPPQRAAVSRSSRKASARERAPAPVEPPEPFGVGATIGVALCLIIPTGLFMVLVVTIVGGITSEARVAFGHEGTPGTATVVSCRSYVTGSGRSRSTNYDCKAHFVFDDRSRQPIVIDTVPEAEVGDVFPAALTPEGDRVLPTGRRGMWAVVVAPSGIAFGLAAAVFFCALISRSRKAILGTGAVMTSFLIVMIVAIVNGT